MLDECLVMTHSRVAGGNVGGTIYARLGVIWAVPESGLAAMSTAIPHDIWRITWEKPMTEMALVVVGLFLLAIPPIIPVQYRSWAVDNGARAIGIIVILFAFASTSFVL